MSNKFPHVSDSFIRDFLEGENPDEYNWGDIVKVVDFVMECAQADQHNEAVDFATMDLRMESYYAAEIALGQRNRFEVLEASRAFFSN